MKKTKALLTILVLIVLGLSTYCGQLIIAREKNKEDKETSNRTIERQTNLISDYQVIQLYNWMIGFDSLNNIDVKSLYETNKSIKLFDLITQPKAILVIEDGMCEACIQKELLNIKKVAQTMGFENIILLLKGYTRRYLANSDEFQDWKGNIYQVDDWITTNHGNLSGTPCLLIVDRSKKIRGVYHALKSTNENFEFFISALKQNLHAL
tara:strand:- start:8972 stop:9598 length:627 start_codon:yes stop_codon:yes gene_type:complete